MIAKIDRLIVRTYRDNGQTVAYVHWTDNHGRHGRTESSQPNSSHIRALFDRGERQGLTPEFQVW